MQKKYTIVLTNEQYEEMLEHVENSEIVAYDTETTGLNTRSDTIIGIAISGAVGVGYYLPLLAWDLQSESLKKITDFNHNLLFEALLEKKLIMHNASFDCRITKSNFSYDLLPALHADTILLKHTVDEEPPFKLKDIAKAIQKEIGLDVKKAANEEQIKMVESIKANGGQVTKENYDLYRADYNIIGEYAAADADLTIRVYEYYIEKLKNEGLEKFFFDDEVMPLYRLVTVPMEERGIPVDVLALQEAQKEIIDDLKFLEDSIQEQIEPLLPDFEKWYLWSKYPPRRSGSFAQHLCEYYKIDLPRTKSGRFSITEANLGACCPESADAKAAVDFMLGGSYLRDDIVHTIQMQMFAEDGEEHMFNLSSKHHLKKLFFEILDEKPVSKTPKGNPQVDHLFLQSIKNKYEWMPMLLDYNKLTKLKGAYIDRFLERQENGIFYPSFFQHRTISGRYGSDLQQLPRPLEEGQASDIVIKHTNKIRKMFVSGSNHVFIDSDYESLEPHVFAHVSGDKGIKDIFKNGNDFYSTIAIDTEGLQGVSADKKADNYLGKINKSLRQKAKAYALGIPYGMKAFKLSKTLDIGQKDAERLINKYLDAYPALAKWMRWSDEQCITKGEVSSEAGRKRHMKSAPKIWAGHSRYILEPLKLWEKFSDNPKKYDQMKYLRRQMVNYLNNAKNFQIQSLAASITNRACIKIAQELKRQGIDGYICAQIHDQIVVRVPKNHAEKVRKMVQYIMENTYKLSVPLKAPAEIGKNLYEAH